MGIHCFKEFVKWSVNLFYNEVLFHNLSKTAKIKVPTPLIGIGRIYINFISSL